MLVRTTIAIGILGISTAAGIAAGRALDITLAERTTAVAAPTTSATTDPLPIRLVDAGGVGIVPDSAAWGGSYSHGTGAFHSLIRPGSAQLDAAAFERIERDWRTYVDRMAGYGNNAVAVGTFLELIDFDRFDDGERVYPTGDVFRERHEALRAAFGKLFHYAAHSGMDVYLKTDMLALTPPLEHTLRAETGGLNTADARLWQVYAAGVDELFDRMPYVRGVMIRIGEAGALYNSDVWEYRSEMAVREPEQLRMMLNTLLPVFERHGRQLVLRSWSVGVGALGALHTDPAQYDAVLGDIASPNLIVSTKYTAGDYFGFLPLNATLTTGRHRRLIEFQARREFEAFSAFPNFLGSEHANAVRTLTLANPNIAGMSLWTQEGGPLHAGPMSLYPVHGFWHWIDANVYATSRLMHDPGADPAELARAWVRETISTDPVVVAGLSNVLMRSRAAVEKALYVRPFAEKDVRIGQIASTPMMWIMEWDVVGDWNAVSSTVYRAARGEVDEAIADGFEAVRDVAQMRATLEELAPKLQEQPTYPEMLRSLEYEESLFQALAWYRKTFLTRYRWLDTGTADAQQAWRESAEQFRSAALAHQVSFGGDLDFPAYDFAPAVAGLERAERSLLARNGARITLAVLVLLLLAGCTGQRLGHTILRSGASWTIGILTLATCGLTVSFVFAFSAAGLAVGLMLLLVAFAAALEGGWSGPTVFRQGGHAAAVLGPLLLGALATLGIIAVRGPDYFWFRFWSDDAFRAAALGLAACVALWTLATAHVSGRRTRGLSAAGALGSTLIAAGIALIVLSALLPDLPRLLTSLDAPLAILPVRFALVVAVTTYANVPAAVLWYPAFAGVVFVGVGGALRRMNAGPPLRTQRSVHAPDGRTVAPQPASSN